MRAQLCRWRGRRRRLAVQCVRDASCSPAPRCLLTVATRRMYSNTQQFSEWVSLVDTRRFAVVCPLWTMVRIISPGSLYATTFVALAITTKSSRQRRSPTDWPTNWPTDWPMDWRIDWTTNWLKDWPTSWPLDWPTNWQVDWPAVWPTVWPTNCQTSWPTDWPTA